MSLVHLKMFFYRPQHMNVPILADQQEFICISFVWTQDVIRRTCQEQWMVGTDGERKRAKEIFAVGVTWWWWWWSTKISTTPIYHHHHHVVPLAQISLTLSCHFSLSFIAFGRSSGLHPVSSHSCCTYVRAGCPAFAWPYAGVYRSTSLMSSSLLLQQYPACLVRLTCIVFVMGGRWPYSWCLVGCCCQDLFNIALNILV